MLFSGSLQRPVYPGYDAVKQVGVHLLGQSISGIDRPLLRLRLHQRLGRKNDPPMAQPAHQRLRLHSQQLAEEGQVWVSELQGRTATLKRRVVRSPPFTQAGAQTHGYGRTVTSGIADFHIAQVQNGRQYLEDVGLKVLLEPWRSNMNMKQCTKMSP